MPRGGKREGAGRKSKAEEMGLPALIEEIVTETGKRDLIKTIHEKAIAGSFMHAQLLMHYMYGKPQDSLDLTTKGEKIEGTKEIIFRNYGAKP